MAHYHPSNALLIQYASGQLDDALGLIVACHVDNCEQCQKIVAQFSDIGGDLLEEQTSAPLSNDLFEAVLEGIEQPVDTGAQPENVEPAHPRPLSRFLPDNLEDIKWKGLTRVKSYTLPFSDKKLEAKLLKIPAGVQVPFHTHGGHEFTFIIQGAFEDEFGLYREQDFIETDGSVSHSPRVTDDADCICFAVLSGPLKMHGPLGPVLDKLLPYL